MPNYIRARVSGGTFFFTVTLADRSSNLLIERVDDLGIVCSGPKGHAVSV